MKKLFFKYQILLFSFTFGLIFHHELGVLAGDKRFIDIKSCRNYPYKEGINFLRKKNNSFKLYSTSKAYLKYGRQTLSSLEAKEAGLRAKLQIANFVKIANSPNIEDIKFDISKIYIKGRRLTSKLRLKKYLNNTYFGNSNSFQGLISIGMCKDSENYIMSTYLVSDKLIKASEEIIKMRGEIESSNLNEKDKELIMNDKESEFSNLKEKNGEITKTDKKT